VPGLLPGHDIELPGHEAELPGHEAALPGHEAALPGHVEALPGHEVSVAFDSRPTSDIASAQLVANNITRICEERDMRHPLSKGCARYCTEGFRGDGGCITPYLEDMRHESDQGWRIVSTLAIGKKITVIFQSVASQRDVEFNRQGCV
jgi:hypothetical protein